MADLKADLKEDQLEFVANAIANCVSQVTESFEAFANKTKTVDEETGSKAPPSTPIRSDSEVVPETVPEKSEANAEDDVKEKEKKEKTFSRFPKFKVTWDPKIPSLMSLKNPKKKSRNVITERFGISMAQEMSPQATLVEFIVTSASFHGVKRQTLQALEDELFRVFRNNVMPANAAAWYMAKRRFYNKGTTNQLLPLLLKEYPKKFAIKNNVVQFLESYTPAIARAKMRYLVEQGLYAYFSHKADEYGVYFFDPLYYEETEPFHANLRIVTNTYNNSSATRLVPNFFKQFKKQFHYQQLSPCLVSISKNDTEIVSGVTGVLLTMIDKKYGLIKFNRGTQTCIALFSKNALFKDGYLYRQDPKALPPVYMDAYKIPNGDKLDRFQWFAVLTWVGRKPNPKFCSTKDELMNAVPFKLALASNNIEPPKKPEVNSSYMKMGMVSEIKKNGAVAVVTKENGEKESYFVPGWMYQHINIPKIKFLTTTQGIGLCIGDLINFYVDPKLEASPYVAVACNVDVLKHVENPAKGGKNSRRRRRTSSQRSLKKKTPVHEWKKFLLSENLDDPKTDSEAGDPDYKPPDNLDDSSEMESNISEDELRDLVEALKHDLKLEDLPPQEDGDKKTTSTTTTTTISEEKKAVISEDTVEKVKEDKPPEIPPGVEEVLI